MRHCEASKTLSSYLIQLVKSRKIAPTVHKVSLTVGIFKKLFEKRELADVNTQNPRALLQRAWFQISLYFGKRSRENQSLLKKSMLHLVKHIPIPSRDNYLRNLIEKAERTKTYETESSFLSKRKKAKKTPRISAFNFISPFSC